MSAEVVRPQVESAHPEQDPPVTNWLVALSHDSPLEQPEAGAARAGTPPPLTAVPSLLSLLTDSDPDVRLRAAAALGSLAGEARRVLPAVRAGLAEMALHDEEDGVRAEAVQALLRAGPQPATEVAALADALHGELDVVRFHAALALGDVGPAGRPAVPELIHASLWDEEPAVRVGAALALWKIDGRAPLVLQVLTEALAGADELLCWVAADGLGQMGPAAREAGPALRAALRRDFKLSLIRTAVKLALERIGAQAPREAG